MSEERKMSVSEVVDFIENKIQIDVGVLSAEDIVKTTEVFDRAIELIEEGELLRQKNKKLEKEKADLENLVAINKGAMRAYRESFEKAHDEAVKDFSHFLIDKAKDGSVDICDLSDLVAEWRSPERKDAELMKEIGEVFQEGVEGGEEE